MHLISGLPPEKPAQLTCGQLLNKLNSTVAFEELEFKHQYPRGWRQEVVELGCRNKARR